MRRVNGETNVALTAGTRYSEPFKISDDTVRLLAHVTVGNNAAVDFEVQGSEDPNAADANWEPTALEATALNNNRGQIGTTGGDGTIFPAYTYYRMKTVTAGVNTISWRCVGLGG